jgi:hypothetical protein
VSLPAARGPLSAFVLAAMRTGKVPDLPPVVDEEVLRGDALDDDDLHLALYLLYELHYGFDGIDDGGDAGGHDTGDHDTGDHDTRGDASGHVHDLEWSPALLAFRAALERTFEGALRRAIHTAPFEDIRAAIRDAISGDDGPSLSAAMARAGTLAELREFAVHRSAYQLKEADPHTWAIPRLRGDAKAALVRIQTDEYGLGDTAGMHSSLFADTLRCLGLDHRPNAYLDALPGTTLATVNLVSMFGLHRRLRGALVGHLTVFEMTSVVPMSRYSAALDRLGVAASGRAFYDAHVTADAVHQVIALDQLAAGFVRDEPAQANEVLFGTHAVLLVERRFARHLLESWADGESSLLLARTAAA